MGLYAIHNYYADKYFEHLEYIDSIVKSPSIVDFGTTMINKGKPKRNKRRK